MNILPAVLFMGLLLLLIFIILSLAQHYWVTSENPLIEQVNQLLPQTQCAQCGYPGCKPYARAIIEANEAINLCPPGGEHTVQGLAALLQQEAPPLAHDTSSEASVVHIREAECIGCTLCIQACPVDAILGASKQMHTVLSDICTGCNLCLEPCPVDCIEIVKREGNHV
jgi:electron transport complex protein RnfB